MEAQRQFEQEAGLSAADAYTACGQVAASAFAATYGRNPSPAEALDLARKVGWSPATGMAGPASEVALLKAIGVDAHLSSGINWQDVQSSAQSGNPVILNTPNHYLYVDGYNADTGAYHVGASGSSLRGGAEWMTPIRSPPCRAPTGQPTQPSLSITRCPQRRPRRSAPRSSRSPSGTGWAAAVARQPIASPRKRRTP